MQTWLVILTAVLSSTLVLEIYRNIRSDIQRRKEKSLYMNELPAKFEKLDRKVDQIQSTNREEFRYIREHFNEDSKHFTKLDNGLSEVQRALNRNAEGTALGLENDIIIFNAFRDNHINGESEKAEKKVRAYLMASAAETLKV